MTVYRGIARHKTELGAIVHADSSIRSWDGWPDQIRETVRRWNADGRLRFVYDDRTFRCPDCRRYVSAVGSTACRLDGDLVCDDCVIDRAVRYGRRGRPETPLERARRLVASHRRRIARYRHNAIQERAYVVGLLERVRAGAEQAEELMLLAEARRGRPDEHDRVAEALQALEGIRATVRPYLEKNR